MHPAWNGPFSREVIDRFKLINFRFVGVRGNISKRLLKDWGIDSEVIGDPCLSLRPKEVLRRVHNRVAINVGIASPRYSWGNRDRVLGELAKVCEVLNERGFEVILIPFWEKSLPDIERLSEKTGAEVFWNWQDLDSTLNLISTSKVFIGEKLHSLVFSAAVNTPFIGLAYAPAHFDFVDSVGFSKFTTKTTEISGETVIELFNELLDDYDQIQFRLKSSVDKYREKQIQFSQKIHSDLESLSSDKWALGNNNANTLMLGADFFFQARLRRMWGLWSRLAFTPS